MTLLRPPLALISSYDPSAGISDPLPYLSAHSFDIHCRFSRGPSVYQIAVMPRVRKDVGLKSRNVGSSGAAGRADEQAILSIYVQVLTEALGKGIIIGGDEPGESEMFAAQVNDDARSQDLEDPSLRHDLFINRG